MNEGVLMAIRELQREVLVQEEYEEDEYADDISVDELWAEIDQKSRQHFDLSADDFAQLYRQGAFPNSFAVSELGFLLRCIDDSFIPA